MDTPERENLFDRYRGQSWEEEYTQYRHNWSEFPRQQFVSEFPLLVDIELSSLCNLKCPMCYTITDEFKRKVNATRMSWELFAKIVDEISGNVPAIRLSLRGESLLHERFVDCVRYAKQKGIKEVSTLTNGAKLTLPYFIELVDAGIDWITISIDGIGKTYEEIRKPIKFNYLLNNIKSIKRYKDATGLTRPVIKIQGIWPAIRENPLAYYSTFEPYVDLVAFNPLIDYLGNDSHIEYLDNFTCPQQYQRLVIGADGLVMKCSNDEENQEIIGDVNNQSVYEIWHSEKMNSVRELHKRDLGFMESAVCKRCYLPRKTEDEVAEVSGRQFTVKNYVSRNQVIGK